MSVPARGGSGGARRQRLFVRLSSSAAPIPVWLAGVGVVADFTMGVAAWTRAAVRSARGVVLSLGEPAAAAAAVVAAADVSLSAAAASPQVRAIVAASVLL